MKNINKKSKKVKILSIAAGIIAVVIAVGTPSYLVAARDCPTKISQSGYDYFQYGIGKDGALSTECYFYNFLLRTPKKILDDYVGCGNKICVESPVAYFLRGGAGNIDYAAAYIDLTDDQTKAYDMHILRKENQYSQDETMMHELGHFVDCQLGVISSSDEWLEIVNEESSKSLYGMLKSPDGESYYYRNPKEFWAQEFSLYLNYVHGDNEGGLDEKENCPKAFEFIENTLKQHYGEDVFLEMAAD